MSSVYDLFIFSYIFFLFYIHYLGLRYSVPELSLYIDLLQCMTLAKIIKPNT